MNIVILEPIGISSEECQKQLSDHHVTEVDSRNWTDEQVIESAKDAEIIMITNRLLPAKIIDNLPLLLSTRSCNTVARACNVSLRKNNGRSGRPMPSIRI